MTVIGPGTAIFSGRWYATGDAQIVDRCGIAPNDLAGDARHHAIGGAIAIDRLVDEGLGIDAVPFAGDMKDEMRPPHLAVGQNIEAELFLLAQHDDRGIIQGLLERLAGHAEGRFVALGLGKPARTGKTADARRGKGGQVAWMDVTRA